AEPNTHSRLPKSLMANEETVLEHFKKLSAAPIDQIRANLTTLERHYGPITDWLAHDITHKGELAWDSLINAMQANHDMAQRCLDEGPHLILTHDWEPGSRAGSTIRSGLRAIDLLDKDEVRQALPEGARLSKVIDKNLIA